MLMLALVFQTLSRRRGEGRRRHQLDRHHGPDRAAWPVPDLVSAGLATLYAGPMIVAGGCKFLLLSTLLNVPSTALFVLAMREQRRPVFRLAEGLLFCALAIGAVVGGYGLASGAIAIWRQRVTRQDAILACRCLSPPLPVKRARVELAAILHWPSL